MRVRPLATIAVLLIVGLSAGCGKEPASQTKPQPSMDPAFSQIDQEASRLVNGQAQWTRPEKITVEVPTRVGLQIGEGAQVKSKLDTLIPGAMKVPAGQVQVGPTVRVTLEADPDDADITPSEGVNASTGSAVQMLWTWLVKAKHPGEIYLNAHLEIPLSSGHVITNDLPLTLDVDRTFSYTAWKVVTNWGTWSAVAASLISVGGWLWARRAKLRRKAKQSAPAGA